MTRLFTLAAFSVALFAPLTALFAEDQTDPDALTMMQRMEIRRLTSALDLEEGQVEKIRKLFIENNRRQRESMEKLLSQEQAAKFAKMQKQKRKLGRNVVSIGGPGGMSFPGSSMSFSTGGSSPLDGLTADMIAGKLGLDIPQTEACAEALKKYTKKKKDATQDAMKNFDFMGLAERIKDIEKDACKAIRRVLDDAQKKAFEKLLTERRKKGGSFSKMFGGKDSPFDMGGLVKQLEKSLGKIKGTLNGKAFNLSGLAEASLASIEKDLACSPEESQILMPKIRRIRGIRKELAKLMATARIEMRALMGKDDAETLSSRVDQYRARRDELRRSMALARNDLVELLTYEQETCLLIHGILE
jgi:Spy/CpxP family protein refolding chaperone